MTIASKAKSLLLAIMVTAVIMSGGMFTASAASFVVAERAEAREAGCYKPGYRNHAGRIGTGFHSTEYLARVGGPGVWKYHHSAQAYNGTGPIPSQNYTYVKNC